MRQVVSCIVTLRLLVQKYGLSNSRKEYTDDMRKFFDPPSEFQIDSFFRQYAYAWIRNIQQKKLFKYPISAFSSVSFNYPKSTFIQLLNKFLFIISNQKERKISSNIFFLTNRKKLRFLHNNKQQYTVLLIK